MKEGNYPPNDEGVARMLNYLMTNKKLPAELPQAAIQQSRDGMILAGFPKHLIPKEAKCKECDYVLTDPLLITAKGRILTTTGVVEGSNVTVSLILASNILMIIQYVSHTH